MPRRGQPIDRGIGSLIYPLRRFDVLVGGLVGLPNRIANVFLVGEQAFHRPATGAG